MYKLEEIREQYKGGTVTIVGNGPNLVKMPEPEDYFKRFLYVQKQQAAGNAAPISAYEDPRALVRRLEHHPNPLWTINGAWTYHPKSTLGFLMDDHRFHTAETHPQPEWYDGIVKESKIPVITSIKYPQYPYMVAFPLREAIKEFRTTYFGETVDYMVCLAILFQVKKIEFIGCDYMHHDRFPGERAGTEYWIGRAEERGITCDASQSFNLMKQSPWEKCYHPKFYGYGRDSFPISDEELQCLLRGEEYVKEAVA